jgi:hypothetical protein
MQDNVDVVATQLEKVEKNVPTLYDNDDLFYTSVEKAQVEVVSTRDMRIPLKLHPGSAFGYFDTDNGDMGTGEAPDYDKAVISTVNMKLAVQWTTKAEWGTDDKRKAVINTLNDLLANSMAEFRRQSESQCMTAGTGVLATVTSIAPAGGVDTITCTTDGFGVKLLRVGQRVSVYDATRVTNKTPGGPQKITFIDITNKTFKIASVPGIIAGDVILPEGLVGSTPVGLYGLPYHVSNSTSGSWLGLSRSAIPEIVSNGVDASSALALEHGRLAINKIGDRVGIDKNYKPEAWMHPAQAASYESLGTLVSIIQKQAKAEDLNLYFGEGMQIAGAPVKTSFLWDKTRIDFNISSLWGRAELKAPGFYTVGGRKIFEMRGPSGGVATSQIFYIVASWNLFHKNPQAASYIYNLTVPAGY